MEAHEALIAGALGLASLYAWQRRRDPLDKWLALATLWICVTGIAALLMTRLPDPARYIRLALRLTGPPLLLLLCEESVRTRSNPGSRRTSMLFAVVIWSLALGALIYFRAGTLVELQLPDFLLGLRFGVTSWMALLAVCFLAALMTVVPAATRRLNPGFAGAAALLLLFSEGWAAIDPRWGSGAIAASVSYRTLLTFALAALAVLKAHQPAWTWLMTAASQEPLDAEKPASASDAPKTPAASKTSDESASEEEDEEDDDPSSRPSKAEPRTSKPSQRASSTPKKKGKKKGKR